MKLLKGLSSGVHLTYNERQRLVTMQKYGLFYKPVKGLLVGLEYKKGGILNQIDTTLYHRANATTEVTSVTTYDLGYQNLSQTTAVAKMISPTT